jgi:hypothetical protein
MYCEKITVLKACKQACTVHMCSTQRLEQQQAHQHHHDQRNAPSTTAGKQAVADQQLQPLLW